MIKEAMKYQPFRICGSNRNYEAPWWLLCPPPPLPPTLGSRCLEHPESGWLVLKSDGSIMYLFKNAHSSLKSQVEEEMAFWYVVELLIPASLYSEMALVFCCLVHRFCWVPIHSHTELTTFYGPRGHTDERFKIPGPQGICIPPNNFFQ